MTCAVVLWVLLGTPAGYVSARMYKSKYMQIFNVAQHVKFRVAGLNINLQQELVSQTTYPYLLMLPFCKTVGKSLDLEIVFTYSPQHSEVRSGRQMSCLQLCSALGEYCFLSFFPLFLSRNKSEVGRSWGKANCYDACL